LGAVPAARGGLDHADPRRAILSPRKLPLGRYGLRPSRPSASLRADPWQRSSPARTGTCRDGTKSRCLMC